MIRSTCTPTTPGWDVSAAHANPPPHPPSPPPLPLSDPAFCHVSKTIRRYSFLTHYERHEFCPSTPHNDRQLSNSDLSTLNPTRYRRGGGRGRVGGEKEMILSPIIKSTYLKIINTARKILYRGRRVIHSSRIDIGQLANPSQVEIGPNVESNSRPRRSNVHRVTIIDSQTSILCISHSFDRVPRVQTDCNVTHCLADALAKVISQLDKPKDIAEE